MRRLTVAAMAVIIADLVFWPNPSAARRKSALEVPQQIVAQLLEEGYEIEVKPDGGARNLAAEAIELNRDREPEITVHGTGSICGAANCVTWVYQKQGSSYRLLLDAGSVHRIEPQKSYTKGYRDLMTAMHGSAWDSDLTLYKFDGTQYQRVGCFFRTYQYEDKHGALREWKRPKITTEECNPDE